MTDRELLEQIYLLLLSIYNKLDDNKDFSINIAADLLSNMLHDGKERINN